MTSVSPQSVPAHNDVPRLLPFQAGNYREYTVESIKDVLAGLRIIRLKPRKDAYAYDAGQYVWLGFGGFEGRPYSIANAPEANGALEFHIKDTNAGGASTYAVEKLIQGETVKVSAPEGESVFDETVHHARPLLLMAGGLGIAPIKAICEKTLSENRTSPVTLYWGTRTEDLLYCRTIFEEFAGKYGCFSFHTVVNEPVCKSALTEHDDLSDYSVFMGGPVAMIEAALPLLQDRNADMAQVYYDRWS